ncbi:putative disease resistance protein RGA3 [Hordeum vulgare subsp. vulgare]|uniref:Uncharacterized protein n=1 Tax=Hordeum vulgare subsp. vulgare TaxID=112509 RepID=A0A8I6YPM7_HORVV|nr:putative disease resistance protein RGA3 [Hordeum vulgare subsp. vulgare]
MGSLLIPLVGSVAAKAGDALVGELLRAWGLDKARRKLERHLAAVQCILLDADAKSRTNPAVRRWMTDLKTVAYQADDVLDDFRYEALRRRALHMRCRSTAHKLLSYFTVTSRVVFRLSMSRKMKDTLEMIDELVVEMNNFHFLQHVEAPSAVHPQTHSHVDESEIVGKQTDKEQVVKILLDHSNNNKVGDNKVMLLPIIGMGGIGKTTLAQLVHNDKRVVHHFELVIWVCVSDKFVIEEIIQSIIQVTKMKKCDLTQMEAMQKELCQVLGKKRYLLVLDDVWNEDTQKWDDMRSLLCSYAGSGSAIIVTSRSNQVASIMGTHPPHQISLLNDYQSWKLFRRNAFGGEVEKQEELISMAESIVLKCKGLPLAIKTIAALLRSKPHSQWFSILVSDVWKDEIVKTSGIIPALQLSYDHLSSEEKICFSIFALFPKDSPMDKDMLIQLWMANNFIASETRGQQIFDVLVSRCFLQDVEIQEERVAFGNAYGLYACSDEVFMHRPTTCKMHDLMRDLVDSVSGNDCSILQESSCQEIVKGSIDASSLQHEVRHLSLEYVSDNTTATMKEILASRPRTILVGGEKGFSRTSLRIAKSKFMSLRALKIFSINTHMSNSKHLRYLDISRSNISALPEATTMLYNLQTLRLNYCGRLKKLPEGMRYMISLRHIFLVGCFSLKRMPEGISRLNSLQTLTNYVIDSDVGRGIDQLKDLNLSGSLSLTGLRKVHSAENAKQGNISAKHNLKRLSLSWKKSIPVGYEVDTNTEGILEALRPHKRLEVLALSHYNGAKLSTWMHNSTLLEHLCDLRLSSCRNCKDLPPLWRLPSLVYLSLYQMPRLTSICVGNDDVETCIATPPFFPKLETFILYRMSSLKRWRQEMAGQVTHVSFPQLKKLTIIDCEVLETLPQGLLQQLPALEELFICQCNYLVGAFSTGGAYWNLVEGIPKRKVEPYSVLVDRYWY